MVFHDKTPFLCVRYIISDFGMRLHGFGQNITKAYELKNATEEDEKSHSVALILPSI